MYFYQGDGGSSTAIYAAGALSANNYNSGTLYRTPQPRHQGRFNMVHFDGHIESFKEFGPGNTEMAEKANPIVE